MNRRTEPRFQVYALAKVALFDDPNTEFASELVDVSGAGLRILVPLEIETDQIITVETDQHLILADVRNCFAHGNKFSVGAERIHSAAKLSLPQTETRIERNQVLVEDFHRRLNDELQRPPGSGTLRPTAAAERFQAHYRGPEAAPESTPVADVPAPEPLAPEPLAPEPLAPEPLAPEGPLEEPMLAQPDLAEPVPVAVVSTLQMTQVTVTAEVGVAEMPQSIPVAEVSAPVAVEPVPEEPPVVQSDLAEPMPAVTSADEISEASPVPEAIVVETPPQPIETPVPLPPAPPSRDPDELLRSAFSQPMIDSAKANARSRMMAVLIATALTVVAVAALWFGPFAKRAPLQTSVDAKSSTTTPSPAPAPVAKSPAPVVTPAVPGPQVTPPPASGKTHASITTSDRSWITACVDGKITFSKLFVSGSKDDLAFSKRAVVRMGSAGPVEIVLNGKSIGSLGRVGQVRVVELTPDTFRFLTPGDPTDCTN